MRKILTKVQDLENEGYQFETAEASFDLLVRKFMGHTKKFFELEYYRTVNLKKVDDIPTTEAIIKLKVGPHS